jgi:2-hydroxy-3-oxopropionate reductase
MMQSYDRATPVGFIGLGVMGAGMARRLHAGGYALTVQNRSPARAAPLAALGASVAESPQAVGRACRVVFLSLPETADVEQVLFGEQGFAATLAPGACVIDTSTIAADASRVFAGRLQDAGVHMLDAPVSGGAQGAEQGTLTCMVGGPEAVFEACREICSAIATRYLRMGDHGAGQAAKGCNQVAVAAAMMGVAEAFALARKQGVELAILREALLGGAAKSFALEKHGPRFIDRGFAPGFTARLMRKDLHLATEAGHEGGVYMPTAHSALQLLEALCSQGSGELDWSALGVMVERLSGIELPPKLGTAP